MSDLILPDLTQDLHSSRCMGCGEPLMANVHNGHCATCAGIETPAVPNVERLEAQALAVMQEQYNATLVRQARTHDRAERKVLEHTLSVLRYEMDRLRKDMAKRERTPGEAA